MGEATEKEVLLAQIESLTARLNEAEYELAVCRAQGRATAQKAISEYDLDFTTGIIDEEILVKTSYGVKGIVASAGLSLPTTINELSSVIAERYVHPLYAQWFKTFFSVEFVRENVRDGVLEHSFETKLVLGEYGDVFVRFAMPVIVDPKSGHLTAHGVMTDVSNRYKLVAPVEYGEFSGARNALVTSLRQVFSLVYVVDIQADTFDEFVSTDRMRGLSILSSKVPSAREVIKRTAEFVSDAGRAAFLEAMDLDALPAKLVGSAFLTNDFQNVEGRWMRIHVIPVRDDAESGNEPASRVVLAVQDVTTDRERERELEETAEAISTIHEALGSADWRVYYDSSENVAGVSWGDNLRRLLGYSGQGDFPDTMEFFDSLVHPDDHGSLLSGMIAAKRDLEAEGGVLSSRYRMRTKRGDYVWCRTNAIVKRNGLGKVETACGVTMDVTELEAANLFVSEALAATNAVHDALGSGDWQMSFGEDGEMIACVWSDRFRKLVGFNSLEDFPNKLESWSDLLHPEDKDAVLAKYWEAVRDCTNKTTYDVSYRMKTKQGEYRWFRAAGRLTRYANGAPKSFYGMFLDVTDRVTNAEKLNHRMSIIQSVINSYFAAYYVDLANDEYAEILTLEGYAGDMQRKGAAQLAFDGKIEEIIAPAYLDVMRDFFDMSTWADRLRETNAISQQYVGVARGWCQVHVIACDRSQDGLVTSVVVCAEDINQAKELESKNNAAIEAARIEAEAANAAKTSFLFSMSHDIRTPMNAIIGFADLMQKNLDDRDKCENYLHKIQSSSATLLSIINNVLEMARIEKGVTEVEETPCEALLFNDTLFSVFQEGMRAKGVAFTREVNVEHRFVYCDTTKLSQVFNNILSNAFKYTRAGDTVHMCLDEIPCERPGYARYQTVITDTGIGMSEEFLPTLFEEFTREKNSTESKIEGTGLGMPIVKRLVELMGGTVEVESALGEGTTFVITIDHRIAEERSLDKARKTHSSADVGRIKRLLLAEDNDLNAEIASEILAEHGIEVERAEDGAVAVKMLTSLPEGYYDAVLMDVQMPNMNGYEATRAIRELGKPALAGIPIIAMTANAFEEDKRDAMKAGMNAHVAKPVDFEELLDVISTAMN